MESLANNRPRTMGTRAQRTYRVEMGGRTVLVSLGLAVLTGLVIFYMGVLAGKSSRSAAIPEPIAETPGEALPTAPDRLAFSESLLEDKPVVEDLQQTQRDTQDLLARAQRELTVEEVPAAAPRAAEPPAAKPEPAPAPQAQRDTPKGNAATELFTVQVFSSKSRESAAELVGKLKGMGFAAYLNQFQDSKKNTWYRVRVGRTSKTDAERLQSSLEKKANLKSTQVLPL